MPPVDDQRALNVSLLLAPVLLVLSSVAGCGSSGVSELELVPVSGTVTTADGEPVANASVMFAAEGETQGPPAYGVTDESGNYELQYTDGRKGCPVGKFRVVISKFAMEDGSPFPEDMPPEDQTAEGVEHLPPRYSNADQSQLTAEVTEGGGTFPFELELK